MVFDLVGDESVLGFTVVEEQCGGIGIALMQAIVLIRFDVFLYVFIVTEETEDVEVTSS